jgi:hypothetical protein
LQDKLDQLTRELDEARQRETATSEVLKIISASPGQLEPVFKDILENAVRICAAKFGVLYQCEEDALRTVSIHGAPQSFVEERRRNPIVRPGPDTTLGRALAAKQPIQIADILEENLIISMFAVRSFPSSLAPELYLRSRWSGKPS